MKRINISADDRLVKKTKSSIMLEFSRISLAHTNPNHAMSLDNCVSENSHSLVAEVSSVHR